MTELKRQVRIGDAQIGESAPVWIIAEAGVNHNGDLGLALELGDSLELLPHGIGQTR